ncbi:MAG: flippase [Muribaculaceae bacterium]|nr:flippase [Roseburia sp.]MCM1431362.1 flippase [Muribaculaceae bacterium]MCM1491804.1 flippase [Muribaculaceae bacterium]
MGNKESILKKNFIYSTFYQVLCMVTPFITAPYLSRVLGADGVGIQSFTGSVQSYFLLFAALGTGVYGQREISRNRDSKAEYSRLFWEIEGISVFTSLICILAWLPVALSGGSYRVYYIASIPNLFAVMFNISWFFSGLEQFRRTVTRSVALRLLGILIMFLFVKGKEDLGLYIGLCSLCSLLSNLSLWLELPAFLERVNMRELHFKVHLKQSFVYFIPTIATSVYTMLDKTLIGLITGSNAQNGYYEQAEKVIGIAQSLSFVSINAVLGVRMAYLFERNKVEEIRERICDSMEFIMFMAVGCGAGIIGVAENFVPFFFGGGYAPVIPLLYVFSPIILIIGVSNCLGAQYYTPSGRRAQSAKYIVAGAGVNLCLNLLLIPEFGATGAAVASMIAELVITVCYVHFSDGYMSAAKWAGISWRKLLSGAVMAVCVMGLGRLPVQPMAVRLGIQILGGVLIYVVLLLLFRDPWCGKQLRDIWRRRIRKNGEIKH